MTRRFFLVALAEPPLLSRHLSSLLNSNDNNGLLVGNWSEDFAGGTEPWVWSGSAGLFEAYVASGGSNGRVKVWDASSGACVKNLEVPSSQHGPIRGICFLPGREAAVLAAGQYSYNQAYASSRRRAQPGSSRARRVL